jgi:tetratricopeptide (TPR) repeat protein
MDLKQLEQRALELMKLADFGDEAIRVNADIVSLDPARESAWTRLGRCYLEQRQFDEAVTALRSALGLNTQNAIATRLLAEVRKQRALTPTAKERATTGFSAREFAMLESLAPNEAAKALQPRIEALFDAVNGTSLSARIVQIRQREGESGTKLFHANSFFAHSPGHIFAFHHGGRWEPQFNIGWFSSPPHDRTALRIGLGFNVSQKSRDPESAAGRERSLAYFERFQHTLEKGWKGELAKWMASSGGFIQYANHPPAVDLLPDAAVAWLLNCRSAAAFEWIFVGRWLFLDQPDDARILGDRGKLATVIDETFRTLYPLWLGTYALQPI